MAQLDAFNADDQFMYSLPGIAEVLGVSDKQIRNYVRDGMEQAARGRYDVRACVAWFTEYKAAGRKNQTESTSSTDLNIARRQRIELDMRRDAGELVALDEVVFTLTEIGTAIAEQLDALGPRIAPKVAHIDEPGKIDELIFNEARLVRAEIAAAGDRLAAQLGPAGRAAIRENDFAGATVRDDHTGDLFVRAGGAATSKP